MSQEKPPYPIPSPSPMWIEPDLPRKEYLFEQSLAQADLSAQQLAETTHIAADGLRLSSMFYVWTQITAAVIVICIAGYHYVTHSASIKTALGF